MNLLRITYIGFSDEMITGLLDTDGISLDCVLTGQNHLSETTRQSIETKKITLYEIRNKKELLDALNKIETKVVLMYKFNYIIPDDIVKKHLFFNIHPGDLRTNRGAHPIRWSVLLGEERTRITLYRIDGIDEGWIIDEPEIVVTPEDTYDTVNVKFDKLVPRLIQSMMQYVQYEKKGVLVKNGVYRRKLNVDDYLISCSQDDYAAVLRKIHCVSDFGGAIISIQGKKYRVRDAALKAVDLKEISENSIIVDLDTRDGQKICLLCEELEWK